MIVSQISSIFGRCSKRIFYDYVLPGRIFVYISVLQSRQHRRTTFCKVHDIIQSGVTSSTQCGYTEIWHIVLRYNILFYKYVYILFYRGRGRLSFVLVEVARNTRQVVMKTDVYTYILHENHEANRCWRVATVTVCVCVCDSGGGDGSYSGTTGGRRIVSRFA